ncbi:MAG: GspH/FimT family pseudopilin [Rhodospirillales bacterium]|nr:GspH/FimT family pseudopilin [Rhodospirillales bacterium]
MSSGRRATAGFTLFEVLVVLAIVGLVTAVVAPVLFRGLAGTEARTVAREIAAALRQARGEAVAHNTDVAVTFDLSRRAYAVERSRPRPVPDGVAMELYAASAEQLDAAVGGIRFFPDGSSTGGQVTIGDGEARYAIDVDWLTGRVSIGEPAGG